MSNYIKLDEMSLLFKYEASFIPHQRHSNMAPYNNYLISLQISLSYGVAGGGGGGDGGA